MAKGSKGNFKQMLLKNGEKVLLGVSVALCAGMLVWGVMELNAAPNSAKMEVDLKNAIKNVDNKVDKADTGTSVPKLPEYAEKADGIKFPVVASTFFSIPSDPFEPVQRPSDRRDNPLVLAPTESQVFYYAGSYKGYDRIFEELDGKLSVRVGKLHRPAFTGL